MPVGTCAGSVISIGVVYETDGPVPAVVGAVVTPAVVGATVVVPGYFGPMLSTAAIPTINITTTATAMAALDV
ncbi:Uncharacterised protein [uncultured archaeon]|nr:Uncharacterised protein [uncultured archaeon]